MASILALSTDLVAVLPGRELTLPNPYAGIEAGIVHPSILFRKDGWSGYRYWLAYTPYPEYRSEHENPCVAASNDGVVWHAQSALPLVEAPYGGYNSDPHIFWSPDFAQIYLVYRERVHTTGLNRLMVIQSRDGKLWSSPEVLFAGRIGITDFGSPSIWWNGFHWVCFSHNLDRGPPWVLERRESSSPDLFGEWGDSVVVQLRPAPHRNWWHSSISVLDDGELCGVFQDNDGTQGAAGRLYFAFSKDDGYSFSEVNLLGNGPQFNRAYRSCLLIEESPEHVGTLFLCDYLQRTVIAVPLRSGRSQVEQRASSLHNSQLAGTSYGSEVIVCADYFDFAFDAPRRLRTDAFPGYKGSLAGWTVEDGALSALSGSPMLWVDAGSANQVVSCRFKRLAVRPSKQWIVVRLDESYTCIQCGVEYARLAEHAELSLRFIRCGEVSETKRIGYIYPGQLISVVVIGPRLAVLVDGIVIFRDVILLDFAGKRCGLRVDNASGAAFAELVCTINNDKNWYFGSTGELVLS